MYGDHPEHPGLYDGPPVLRDGAQPTWFCLGQNIPMGWERRKGVEDTWRLTTPTTYTVPSIWYQVREPEPTVTVAGKTLTKADVRRIVTGYASLPAGATNFAESATNRIWEWLETFDG